MGCCMSHVPPPIPESRINSTVPSFTETTIKSAEPMKYRSKQEPPASCYSTEDEGGDIKPIYKSDKSSSKCDDEIADKQLDAETSSVDDDIPPSTQIETQLSEFQMKVEQRKSELLRQKQKLKELQQDAFDQQVAAQQSRNFKRLYDVWQEFATNDDLTMMNIDGLTKALSVFGMIIDTNRDFQKHIFMKFALDNVKEIDYNDFSATISSFVGSGGCDDDSLQTLFEIFDIDEDGYLELEEMARILLAQNQMAVVVTGKQSQKNQQVYTKQQCLKQARRMIQNYDSQQFNDNKISFEEFKIMMSTRTENDMMIDHMQAPSISLHDVTFHLNDSNNHSNSNVIANL